MELRLLVGAALHTEAGLCVEEMGDEEAVGGDKQWVDFGVVPPAGKRADDS